MVVFRHNFLKTNKQTNFSTEENYESNTYGSIDTETVAVAQPARARHRAPCECSQLSAIFDRPISWDFVVSSLNHACCGARLGPVLDRREVLPGARLFSR
jgi:hypothetical protein